MNVEVDIRPTEPGARIEVTWPSGDTAYHIKVDGDGTLHIMGVCMQNGKLGTGLLIRPEAGNVVRIQQSTAH